MSLAYLSKISVLTILAVGIVACSSTGNGSSNLSTNVNPPIEQTEAEKAEAEKAAAEKAAAEKAAAEKAAAEKAAAEKAAAEKAAAEKAAAEKADAEKAAAEKAEAERLQKIETNRVALLAAAKKSGLTDQQAAAYAEANKTANATDAQIVLDSIVADNAKKALLAEASAAKGISDARYPVGAITASTRASSSSIRNALTQESRIQSVVYNQPYSVVMGDYSGQISYNNQTGAIITDSRESDISIRGLKTTADAIPMLGSATYTGKAFNGTYQNSFNSSTFETTNSIKEGTLSYNINFADRTGSGTITGLGDTVNLQQGVISGTGISAVAQQGFKDGNYLLDFYGKKAEEIAGKVVFDGKDTIGFGGTRGEVSK
ncbi:Slam-dependent surface lipoprotein [Psychrobacter sp. Ps6]|uniref:Slam-dependent surface lipoprotein n=1 Tax=Psychrobacter sp. Ps6 TaxID=2790960 RepID=UPI001EDF3F6E|nr:Slam-dependent surface lipoprotein [Psychrobacter sp. Ps6]